MVLARDDSTRTSIQAFAPTAGFCNLTGGTFEDKTLAHCAADGDLTFEWIGQQSDTISCVAGDDLAIKDNAAVTIVSGTFHLA